MDKQQHLWPIRVYYEDTDSGRVVYHANYLKFMERSRTEWLRSLGFEQTDLLGQFGIIFVVHSMAIQFKSPAYFNDRLEVRSCQLKIGYSSIEFLQTIFRNDQLILEATVKLACVEASNFKPTCIPAKIKQTMNKKQLEPI